MGALILYFVESYTCESINNHYEEPDIERDLLIDVKDDMKAYRYIYRRLGFYLIYCTRITSYHSMQTKTIRRVGGKLHC